MRRRGWCHLLLLLLLLRLPRGGSAGLSLCPDTASCPPRGTNRTVLAIEGGDRQAAFTTIYYLYVVNGAKYAEHRGMVPYVKLSPGWNPRIWRGSK